MPSEEHSCAGMATSKLGNGDELADQIWDGVFEAILVKEECECGLQALGEVAMLLLTEAGLKASTLRRLGVDASRRLLSTWGRGDGGNLE